MEVDKEKKLENEENNNKDNEDKKKICLEGGGTLGWLLIIKSKPSSKKDWVLDT